MPKNLNRKAVSALKELINNNMIDFDSDWSFSDAIDGTALLGSNKNDWETYGSVHLGIDPDATINTKSYYSYPVAKMIDDELKIFRKGVIAAKNASAGGRGAEKNEQIFNASDKLLQMIDEKKEDKTDILVQRYDFFDLLPISNVVSGIEESFIRTEEGFLKGKAIVTNIGVFPYMQNDGSIRRELRHPSDVLDNLSLQTLKMKPVTNEHPVTGVDSKNIGILQVGSLGDSVMNDSYHVAISMIINDENTVNDIIAGKRGLSCGYFTRIEDESGTFLGMDYDVRQKDIVYNHVAIVDRGRAGDSARIKLDGLDKKTAYYIIGKYIKEESMSNLKNLVLDGVQYEAEETVIKTLNKYKMKSDELQVKLDEAKANVEKIQAEFDSLSEKNDKLMKELEDSKNDSERIENAVKERLNLLQVADKAGVEIKEDMSPEEIRKSVILKIFPKANLEGKSDIYIMARYDASIEELESKKDSEKREAFSKQINVEKNDSDTARERMINRIKNKSRGNKEE